MKWIKGSTAKKQYGIPDRIYREACHGINAIAKRPAGAGGHYFFEIGELEEFLTKRMEGKTNEAERIGAVPV